MLTIETLSLEDAKKIIAEIEKTAANDGDCPVAIAIAGADARLIAFIAMDGVRPVCINLAIDKAYTAVLGARDTLFWQEKAEKTAGFNISNYTDSRFTGIAGGIVLKSKDGKVVGGVGVSGRNAAKAGMPDDSPAQDHELAGMAQRFSE